MLELVSSSGDVKIYRTSGQDRLNKLIATTPETRSICNDPQIAGVFYTSGLRKGCASIFKTCSFGLTEDSTVVVNILRGGLNFGLREALSDAYGWNAHTTCFISAQRARNDAGSEEWHITENAYRKVYFPREVSLVIGDVVATGTSLRYALDELIRSALDASCNLRKIVFFTYGGPAAISILEKADLRCRECFPGYEQTTLIFLEGCFSVPNTASPLSIRFTGTDLVRLGAEMAPEFVESQYEDPAYPLERCAIYDAGSRAFWVREYAADVTSYWRQVLDLADRGLTFEEYLAERFPRLDISRFGKVSLREIALRQIERMKVFLPL